MNISEGTMLYALNENGKIVYVDDVPNGLKCKCTCPHCHAPLQAKQGDKNIHSFAHAAGHVDCMHGVETGLHLLAKDLLLEGTPLFLPGTTGFHYYKKDSCRSYQITKPITIKAKKVEAEFPLNDFIPDILIEWSGRKLIVEIYVTHKVDEEKRQKIIKQGISAIEIDLSKCARTITREELKNILETGRVLKSWIYNVKYEEMMALEEENKKRFVDLEKELELKRMQVFNSGKFKMYKEYGRSFDSLGWIYNPPCKEYTSNKDGKEIKYLGSFKMYCNSCPNFVKLEDIEDKTYLLCSKKNK